MSTIEATHMIDEPFQTSLSHNRLLLWGRRVLFGLLLAFVILSVSGASYQAIATERDARSFPPPGRLVDVNGYQMHIHCTGIAQADSPIVILEAGSGMMSAHWAWVQSTLSVAMQVCAYDRAGYGWSEARPTPRDAQHVALELHTLLEQVEISGPYVLVGHSIGGLYVRTFAEQYPDVVTGLVLVDSSHPDQLLRSPGTKAEQEGFTRLLKALPLLARLGVIRISGMSGVTAAGLPAQAGAAVTAFFGTATPYRAMLAEISAWESTTIQSRSGATLASKPLLVVSAGAGSSADWHTLQTELTLLSSNSHQLVVDQASHQSLLINKDDAQITSMAILQVVEAAHRGTPLP